MVLTLFDMFESKKITGIGAGTVLPDFVTVRGGATLLLSALATLTTQPGQQTYTDTKSIFIKR